jgi:hypothetical protein
MGYRGKVVEQEEARRLRADGWALLDIAEKLGVAKSSVSLWVRDVEFEPRPRRTATRMGRKREPNVLQRRKQAEIDQLLQEGKERIGTLSDREFLVAGLALYAGEGSKREGAVKFANSDPRMMRFFASWLREFFDIDETRVRMRVYLHEGLDLDGATSFWSGVACVRVDQFSKPYRAVPDPTIRTVKHEYGCAYLTYSCSRTHRAIMGLIAALLSCPGQSGVAQLVAAPAC